MQEDRKVFHTMFGIVIGDMWGLSFCDSIFGGLDRWGGKNDVVVNVCSFWLSICFQLAMEHLQIRLYL